MSLTTALRGFKIICLLFLSATLNAQNNFATTFNGSSSINCGPNAGINTASTSFTVEAWVYVTTFGANRWDGTIVSDEGDSWAGFVLRCGGSGQLSFAIAIAPGVYPDVYSGNNALSLNKWQHVAGVYNGTNLMIFVDGIMVASTPENRPLAYNSTLPVTLGASSLFAGRSFRGAIDEVRVWSGARTRAEIKRDMFRHISSGTGLVSSYQMSDGSGTTLTDNSGNGNTGTLTGAGWTASPIQWAGNAIAFDGIDDDITIPHDTTLNITSAITLEAWVYATKSTGVQNVISKSSNLQNYGYIFPRTNNGWADITCYLHINGAWRSVAAPYNKMSEWHHLAATYDGAMIKLYIDGAMVNSVAQTGPIATNTVPLELGVQFGYPAEFFGGSADEFRIWNYARTQAQIQANMNKEIDPATNPGLVSYYTANQGIAGGNNSGLLTLVDQAGVNNGVFDGFNLTGPGSNYVSQFSTILLPVQWFSFTAQRQGEKNVLLKWSTASENQSLDFIIQRSANGTDWQNIGTVAASGNTNEITEYSFSDLTSLQGYSYYRIQQRDLDRKSNYSQIVKLKLEQPKSVFTVLGNPVEKDQLNIKIDDPLARLSIYNSSGNLVWQKQLNTGINKVDLSPLAKGIYYLKAGNQLERIILK